MHEPANEPLEETFHDLAIKQVPTVFQFQSMEILHPEEPIPLIDEEVAEAMDIVALAMDIPEVLEAMFILIELLL